MKKQVDYKRMLNTAVAFFLAAERCVPDLAFGQYPLHSVCAPVLTNYGFANEVALKILLLHYGRITPEDKSGHNLKRLFDMLPDDKKSFLQQVDVLSEVANYFVDWRYSYNEDYLFGSHDDIRRIFISIHDEIRRVKPDLVSIYESHWGGFEPDRAWAWYEEETRSYREEYEQE